MHTETLSYSKKSKEKSAFESDNSWTSATGMLKLEELYSKSLKTQHLIDDFKETDPYAFSLFNNLQCLDSDGKVSDVDFIIKIDSNLDVSEFGPANSRYNVPEIGSGNSGYSVEISLTDNESNYIDNALAHEFGHGYGFALDPTGYLLEAIKFPYNNCQNPITRNLKLSEWPIFWQKRYDRFKH